MKKASALEKATVLWGKSVSINEKYVDKYQEQLENVLTEKAKRLGSLKYKLKTSPVGASIEQGKISKLIISEEERYDKKINAFIEKIDYWQSANKKFSFIMEEV